MIKVLVGCCLGLNALLLPTQGELVINIEGVEKTQGSLYVALYVSERKFLEDGANPYGKIIPVSSKTIYSVTFSDLPVGQYAVAVYHDLNNNGKLDKNMLGVPTEPYAFSNNPNVKWRSPSFAETAITLEGKQKSITVELKRWKNY